MTEIKKANVPASAAPKQEVAKKTTPKTMKDYVSMMQPEIKKALPSMIKPERFTRMVVSALSNNKSLQECTPQSFLGAMMSSAQAGLEPNTVLGEAYIIPYRNKGTLEAQFQLGYKGMITLAARAHTTVRAETVYENDEFEYELGMNPKLVHKPALKDRGNPIAYYATWKNADLQADGFTVMSHEDILKYAKKYSKAFESSSSPWQTNFDSMAKKTVIKQALKYAPMNAEVQRMITNDETIKHDISFDMADVKDETDYVDAEYTEVDSDTGEAKA